MSSILMREILLT